MKFWSNTTKEKAVLPAQMDKNLNDVLCKKLSKALDDKYMWVLPPSIWENVAIGDVFQISGGQLERLGSLRKVLDSEELLKDDDTILAMENVEKSASGSKKDEKRIFREMTSEVRSLAISADLRAEFPAETGVKLTAGYQFMAAKEAVLAGSDILIAYYDEIGPLKELMRKDVDLFSETLVVSEVWFFQECTLMFSKGSSGEVLLGMDAGAPATSYASVSGALGGQRMLRESSVKYFYSSADGGSKGVLAKFYHVDSVRASDGEIQIVNAPAKLYFGKDLAAPEDDDEHASTEE